MCRLLAPSSQVGCVLGKGGKIVEKIRVETGAQIRVLSNEQVPVFAAAGDEVIQISGSFPAVRKALLSVSGCLQENSQMDGSSLTPRSFGIPLQGVNSPLDRFAQRGFHAQDHYARGHPSSDMPISGERRNMDEEVAFRILCSNEMVGSIIGRGGITVRNLQSETGATIRIIDAVPECDERVIAISAYESFESKISPTQEAVLLIHAKLVEIGAEKPSVSSFRFLVPSQHIGCLLGRGGNIIAEMRRSTGANIRIFLKEHVPKCAQANDEVVQVTGSFQSVQDALLQITSRLREMIFQPKPNFGTVGYSSIPADNSSAFHRLRSESESPLSRPRAMFNHGLDRSASFAHSRDWQSPLFHNKDQYGSSTAERITFSHASEATRHHSTYEQSNSPWPYASKATDSGLGSSFRSGSGGTTRSAIQTPSQTSTMLEVVVPQQYLRFVYGENSEDLTKIRELSGARVTISDPKPGCTEGLVTLSGSSDQIRAAQMFLHAFILCGRTAATAAE